MSSLSQILHLVQSSNESLRSQAWESMQVRLHSNPQLFLLELSSELICDHSAAHIRQLAGIQMKNVLENVTNDPSLSNIWSSIDIASKQIIRERTIACLASEEAAVRLAASQAVSSIASLDIPKQDWPEVLIVLITNAANINKTYKLSAIRTLGYICEKIGPEFVTSKESDSILTAVADCLQDSERDFEIKEVALVALRNSLKFFRSNFSNDDERTVLINLLAQCCCSESAPVQVLALRVFCEIAVLFYEFIESNLMDIARVTYSLIKSATEDVGLLAAEFWNLIADIEAELSQRLRPSKGYIKQAANSLVPLLLEKVYLDTLDEDEWNFQNASLRILTSISIIIRNLIFEVVGGFIAENLKSEDLRKKNSAVMVIGSIVEGLDSVLLLIQITFEDLFMICQYPDDKLQKSVLWTFGKICNFHINELVKTKYLNKVLELFVRYLDAKVKLAYIACYGVKNILKSKESYYFLEIEQVDFLIDKLLQVSIRPDAFDPVYNLFTSSIYAIMAIIQNSNLSRLALISKRRDSFLEMLQKSEESNNHLAQEMICSLFQMFFGAAQPRSIADPFADKFIHLVLGIFETKRDVIEEGLKALGHLASSIQSSIEPYLASIGPFIQWCILQPSSSLNKAGLITLGDLSRELGSKINHLVQDCYPIILSYLTNTSIMFEIKIRAIETLSDLASNNFDIICENNFDDLLHTINSAVKTSLSPELNDNLDMIDLMCELRESILFFYTGIVEGVNSTNRNHLLNASLNDIVDNVLEILNPCLNPSDQTNFAALGLFGDLWNIYKHNPVLSKPGIRVFIEFMKKLNKPELKDNLEYASQILNN